MGRQSLRNTFSGQTDGLVCSGIGDESRGENGKMVEIGPVPGDGGDEFAGVGQFRDKLVLSDPLQIVADRRLGAEVVIEQDQSRHQRILSAPACIW